MLLIRLLHDLIAQRPDDGPVPVLFSLASWNPTHRPLQSWLADQLRHTYPGLRAPAPSAAPQAGQIDLAQALLDTRRILPLVDGFDELPPALHAIALDALNQALPAKQPLVLASRAAAYREALARSEVLVRPLNGAAGIHLLPLPADQAATYLRHDAGGEHTPAADRWNSVAAHLGTNTLVGQALSTPLGLFLARTIYNPRPDILGAPAPSLTRTSCTTPPSSPPAPPSIPTCSTPTSPPPTPATNRTPPVVSIPGLPHPGLPRPTPGDQP